jgi:thioesterase domain-containing protein
VATDIVMPAVPDGRRRSWIDPLRRLSTAATRPRYAFDRLITIGVDNKYFARLAWLWRALVLLRLHSAQVRFRVLTMRLLRLRARLRHEFEFYPGPVSLFRALDNKGWLEAELPDDLGWSDWCEGVEVSRIPGDHIGMLAPENLEMLTRAVLSQCERSVATQPAAEPQLAGE